MVIFKGPFVQSYCVTACSRGARLCRFTMQRTIPFVRFLWEMVYFKALNLWEMEYFADFFCGKWKISAKLFVGNGIFYYFCTTN